MSIINQIFCLLVGAAAPQEVEEAINRFLPTKDQVKKKRRMHRDLWFFKDHTSTENVSSYWIYLPSDSELVSKESWFIPITNHDGSIVYVEPDNIRDIHRIYGNRFLTWKDGLYTGQCGGRSAYEKLLFDHDGEETSAFPILTETDELVNPEEGASNMGYFLGGGNEGCAESTMRPEGLSILNIISGAMDGKYRVYYDITGFSGDDTGDYKEKVFTIYNTQEEIAPSDNKFFKDFIEEKYKEWSQDPDGRYTGLIIGGRDEEDMGDIINGTGKGDNFFSIFVKPDWTEIEGGYWGYMRDELRNGKIINGPLAAEQSWKSSEEKQQLRDEMEEEMDELWGTNYERKEEAMRSYDKTMGNS